MPFEASAAPRCAAASLDRSRLFAVVPAAGQSRRMGQPKLLLPWGRHTVIEHVLEVLKSCRGTTTSPLTQPSPTRGEGDGLACGHDGSRLCQDVVAVVRADDVLLAEAVRRCGLEPVVPEEAPADMRTSVQLALAEIQKRWQPGVDDAWLLVPADQPTLCRQWIETLAAHWSGDSETILVPVHGGRRGHPVLFPWRYAPAALALPGNTGVNHLLDECARCVHEVALPDPGVLVDMDTPEDYRRLAESAAPD